MAPKEGLEGTGIVTASVDIAGDNTAITAPAESEPQDQHQPQSACTSARETDSPLQTQSNHFVELRPPASPPTAEVPSMRREITSRQRPSHRIRFRHPHYPDSNNVLLDLFAPDHPSGGLQYSFAHVACGIIAGNRWDGAFSETPDGPLLRCDPDEILLNTNYYYHLENSSHENPYPVVPTFREWSFPHDHLPEPWSSLTSLPDSPALNRTHAISSLYPALLSRDVSCRMSACEEGTQAAHIVPQAEDDWFQRNQMSLYNFNPIVIGSRSLDDTANALLLRADLHILFDAGKFVFVPKAPIATAGQCRLPPPELVTHLIVQSRELQTLYHNARLQPIGAVSAEFFFSRFAWAIFPNLAPFLRRGVARNLIGATLTGDGSQSKWLNAQECQRLAIKPPKSRSQSPQKRNRADDDLYDVEMSCDAALERRSQHKRRRFSYTEDEIESLRSETSDDIIATPEYTDEVAIKAPEPYEALRQEWLKQERLKSDPEGTWRREREWATKMRRSNVVLDVSDAKRLYETWGYEIRSDGRSDSDVEEGIGHECIDMRHTDIQTS